MADYVSEEIAYLAAYVFGVLIGGLLIHLVINEMWFLLRAEARPRSEKLAESNDYPFIRYPWQTSSVGFVERALYIASIQIARPEFIAVWLTLKTVARSRRWTEESSVPGRAIYNIFLVGNGLSILFALVSAGTVDWLIGPEKVRNIQLGLGAPAILTLATLALYVWLRILREERSAVIRGVTPFE